MISAGFRKLIERKHVIPFDDLTPTQQNNILTAESSYFIPWDVGFKETSVSTPARPVFDASSRTSTGYSLNDLLAKGDAQIVDLLNMTLNWLIGSSATTGDISQFYNNLLLEEEHWPFQQVYWCEDLDMKKELIRGIIITAIYGVRCVAGQTEEVMGLLAKDIKERYPEVWKLLVKLRYVDDFGKSNRSQAESESLIKDTETVLDTVGMKVKGWAQTGKSPPSEISDDGVSVMFAGLKWIPTIDVFSLGIDILCRHR